MDLKTLDTDKLKALGYDCAAQIESCNNILRNISIELQSRQNPISSSTPVINDSSTEPLIGKDPTGIDEQSVSQA